MRKYFVSFFFLFVILVFPAFAVTTDAQMIYAIRDEIHYETVESQHNGYPVQKIKTVHDKYNLIGINTDTGESHDYGRISEYIWELTVLPDGKLAFYYPVGLFKGKNNAVIRVPENVEPPALDIPTITYPLLNLTPVQNADKLKFYTISTPPKLYGKLKSGYIHVLDKDLNLVKDIPIERNGVGVAIQYNPGENILYVISEGRMPRNLVLRIIDINTDTILKTVPLEIDEITKNKQITPEDVIMKGLEGVEFYHDDSKLPEGSQLGYPQPNTNSYVPNKIAKVGEKLFVLANTPRPSHNITTNQVIYVYDIARNYKLVKEFPITYSTGLLYLSGMKKLYVIDNQQLKIIDTQTLNIKSINARHVTYIGAIGDSKLACISQEKTGRYDLKIFDALKNKFTYTIQGHFGAVSAIKQEN